jgi:hypothetical protein
LDFSLSEGLKAPPPLSWSLKVQDTPTSHNTSTNFSFVCPENFRVGIGILL